MYILTTDVLSCPRCGPEFGLILLAERTESRRVLEGVVACANCRERYPIRGGFADLRVAGASGAAAEGGREPAGEADARAFRLLALLGITEGPALALLVGRAAELAPRLAARVEHLEVIAADAALASEPERPGVTRIAVGRRLPFYDRSLRGVVLSDGAPDTLLVEGARVLAPLGRLVLEGAPAGARARVEELGLKPLAEEGGVLVAVRG
jgi:uncharacterized protein YbaR (Trm112 family)